MENSTVSIFYTLENFTHGVNSNTSMATFSQSKISANTGFHQAVNFGLIGIVIVVGLVANGLIVAIMQDSAFRKLPLGVYFTALAISDTVCLFFVGLLQIFKHSIKLNIYANTGLCSTLGYLLNVVTFTSNWFIVCIAFERFLVVRFPLKAKQVSSKNKAIIAVVSVTVFSFLMNTYQHWMIDYGKTNCKYKAEFLSYAQYGQGTVYITAYHMLPMIITFICYLNLVYLVVRRKNMTSTSNAAKEKITKTALYICLMFLILMSPGSVYILFSRLKGWIFRPNDSSKIFESIAFFLMELNYATNFFINLGSNVIFRGVAKRLLGRAGSVFPTSNPTSTVNVTGM